MHKLVVNVSWTLALAAQTLICQETEFSDSPKKEKARLHGFRYMDEKLSFCAWGSFVPVERRDFSITLAKKPKKTVQSCPDNLHLVCLWIIYNLFLLKTAVSLHVFKVLLRRLSPERPPPYVTAWALRFQNKSTQTWNLVPHIIFQAAPCHLNYSNCAAVYCLSNSKRMKCTDCRIHAERTSCLQDRENHHHHTNNGVDKNLPFSLEITWSFDQEARWPG